MWVYERERSARAREFAERLLALQSIEPKLTADEIKDWDDAALTAVARTWWEEVDRLNSSPLPADSLEAFQGGQIARTMNTSNARPQRNGGERLRGSDSNFRRQRKRRGLPKH